MFTDTGILSFYMGIVFIVLAFIGLFVAYLLLKSSMETAKSEKLIELGKWFIVSVALVVGAAIIADNFKEREQDIKDFQVFDKYVNTIMEADGIEKRFQLAEYFSIVSPPGELRSSWEKYLTKVEAHRKEYLESKQKKEDLEKIKNRTEEQEKTLLDLTDKTQKYEEPLKPVTNAPIESLPVEAQRKTTVDAKELSIIAGTDITLSAAKDELKKAQKINPQAKIYKKGNLFLTIIPGVSSGTEADTLLAWTKLEVNQNAYFKVLKDLCKSVEDGSEFSVCN